MKGLSLRELERENQLRKIVKSLSKVSQVDTKDIRKDIHRSTQSKNAKRTKFLLQNDKLLKQKNASSPSFNFKRNFFDKNNKIGGLRQKKMESEAVLKHVNFEYKKINRRKEQIAKKYRQYLSRFRPKPPVPKPVIYPIDINHLQKIAPQYVFQDGDLAKEYQNQDVQEQFISKMKSTVNSSRLAIKQLYEEHLKSLKLMSLSAKNKQRERTRTELSQIKISEFELDSPLPKLSKNQSSFVEMSPVKNSKEFNMTVYQTPVASLKTKKKYKRRSLIDLIRMSSSRIKHRQEQPDQKMTMKQRIQYSGHDQTIKSLQKVIDKDHKLKESIVFTGLKKLLYGDRKGRFIQDNAFKTRLKGQNTQNYLKILLEQNKIFDQFDGSYFNRRNLAQKLSEILGLLHRSQKTPEKVTHHEQF